jgi:WD40 repeat protein
MRDDRITQQPPQPRAEEPAPRTPKAISIWHSSSIIRTAMLTFGGAAFGGFFDAIQGFSWTLPLWVLVGASIGFMLGRSWAIRELGTGTRTNSADLPQGKHAQKPALPVGTFQLPPGGALIQIPKLHAHKFAGHNHKVRAIAISPDGRLAASTAYYEPIVIWDVQTGFELRTLDAPRQWVNCLAFSPDGRLLASLGQLHTAPRAPAHCQVLIWDVESGQQLRRIEFQDVALSLAFLSDSRRILIGGMNQVRCWDVEGPTPVALVALSNLFASFIEIRAVAGSSNGRFAFAGCASTQNARVIDLETSEEKMALEGHGSWFSLFRRGAVVALDLSPDEKRLLTGSWDQTARVWSLNEASEMRIFRNHCGWLGWYGIAGVAWVDEERVLSASEDGTVYLWGALSGKVWETLKFPGTIHTIAYARACRLLLVAVGRQVYIRRISVE